LLNFNGLARVGEFVHVGRHGLTGY
jgi:hypothetical protein